MANLQSKIKVITQASPPSVPPLLVHEEVQTTFDEFAKKLSAEKTVTLTLKQSYISKYHHLIELRDRFSDDGINIWEQVLKKGTVPAIMKNKTQVPSEAEFTEIADFFKAFRAEPTINNSFGGFFNPPIYMGGYAYLSSSSQLDPNLQQQPEDKVIIYSTPGQVEEQDPRRTGRLIIVTEPINVQRPDVQKFLLNNGPLYGLIPYGKDAIYYYGLTQLKAATKGKTPIELYRILARYAPGPANLADLTITAEAIQKSTFSPIPPPPISVVPARGELTFDYQKVVKQPDGTWGPALAKGGTIVNATNPDGTIIYELERDGRTPQLDKKGNKIPKKIDLGTPMRAGRCSAVVINNKTYHMHTGAEPQFAGQTRTPQQIVLHHTAGWGQDAIGTLMTVGGCNAISEDNKAEYGVTSARYKPVDKAEWYPTSGIHWSVDGHGNALAGINESVISVHGNNWNAYGIGIELGMPGYLTKTGDRLYNDGIERYVNAIPTVGNPVKSNKFGISKANYIDWEIVDMGFTFDGYTYITEVTDNQVTALEKLIREIFGRWPHIERGVTGKNQWIDVWGLTGKPAPGSNVTPRTLATGDGVESPGIRIHTTGIGPDGHHDTGPSPKMVAMLNRLGYNEG